MSTATPGAPRNRSKATGTAFESAVVKYLRANGFGQAERRALRGRDDVGDILVCPGMIAECKAWATFTDGNIADWQAETWREMQAANASIGLLIVKRPRKAVADSWCYFRGEWGYWYCQNLKDGVERLRLCGWGDLV